MGGNRIELLGAGDVDDAQVGTGEQLVFEGDERFVDAARAEAAAEDEQHPLSSAMPSIERPCPLSALITEERTGLPVT